MTANPIKITDTTFRDAHQSLLATRLKTSDMEPMAAGMDAVGFHSMEVWGGATFDVATRYLAEDPWKRLRTFKRLIPNTPLAMLLRGQSLVGYRAYADDVVEDFVARAAETGIDNFRVFDALNDERNLETAARAVTRSGKHLQMTICYSLTEEGRLGGAIYNLEYFVERARRFEQMGADSICVKDMAGLMAPYDAHELFQALRAALKVPLQFHTHYTSGMASMSVLKAVEAGVDIVDACLSPLALRTSQPAVEPLVMSLAGTDRDSGLDLAKLLPLGDQLESVLPAYKEYLDTPKASVIDAKVLSHQIPGGMASNLLSQLRDADAIERLGEVLQEIPRTRKELGYPPLVTPMSQMVGTQAVSNVLFGRYEMVSEQVKHYVGGRYGRPPAALDPDVVKQVLKGEEDGRLAEDLHPTADLEPELDAAREAIKDISDDPHDVLIYALYPTTGLKFLRIKHGLEPPPVEEKLRTPDAVAPTLKTTPSPATRSRAPVPPKSPRVRTFNVFVGGEYYQVEVDPVQAGRGAAATIDELEGFADEDEAQAAADGSGPDSALVVEPGDATVVAPMPGLLLRYSVDVGQHVDAGDAVAVLEAMKMETSLPSPMAGTVKALPLASGSSVVKDDILAVISP